MMEHRGYTGQITSVDENQGVIHGRVVGIADMISFEGSTTEEVIQAFHDSVDDYLDFCEASAHVPEKPFSGKFLVRVPQSVHQRAAFAARQANASLNAWISDVIEERLAVSQKAKKDVVELPGARKIRRKGARPARTHRRRLA